MYHSVVLSTFTWFTNFSLRLGFRFEYIQNSGISVILDIYLGVDCIVILLLFLKKELLYHFYFIYFFVVTASFCIPTNGGQVFQLFHFSHEWLLFSEFFYYFFLNNGHSNGCEVVSHFGFDLLSILKIFSWTHWPIIYLSWRNLSSNPFPSF